MIEAIFGAGGISPQANLYASLHTVDPGEAGDQTANEATYGAYVRQAVAVPAGWTTGLDNAVNANDIIWPEATAGSETVTHFSVGEQASGAGNILYSGALSASVPVSAGVTVKINAGNLAMTED